MSEAREAEEAQLWKYKNKRLWVVTDGYFFIYIIKLLKRKIDLRTVELPEVNVGGKSG